MVSRPSVPLPMRATRPASTSDAACTAQAVGSTSTAASSDRSSGTATSWDSWATISVDQPPPVLSQNPHCRPGSRSPKPMRSQWLMWPSAHGPHTGWIPRATQLSTGTMATREPSSRSPTTSWPGVNGNETMGSNQRDEVPSMVARSEPQMPASRGPHPHPAGTGQLGGVDVAQRQRARPWRRRRATAGPATMAAANLAGFRENTSAFIGCAPWSRPCRRDGGAGGPTPGRWGAAAGRHRPPCRSARRASPRLRASAARRVSGFTATGKPTASSIGRSEVESA